MLFNSYIFWLFFGLVFILYRFLKHRSQNWLLLFASYVFYAWWDVRFLSLVLIATAVSQLAAVGVGETDAPRRRKTLLKLILAYAGGALAMYLCYDLFAIRFVELLSSIGVTVTPRLDPIHHQPWVFRTAHAVVLLIAAVGIGVKDPTRRRKIVLTLAMIATLGILAAFKYYNFFDRQLVAFLNEIGVSASSDVIRVILPIGISFFTFKAISYIVDVYRGQIEPGRRLADVALYIAFFPQLLAGPIERAGRLMPQITQPRRRLTPDDFAQGPYLILMGLFMKMVVADNMSSVVNVIFNRDASTLSGFEVLLGVYAFTFQIYGDFAGNSNTRVWNTRPLFVKNSSSSCVSATWINGTTSSSRLIRWPLTPLPPRCCRRYVLDAIRFT